MQDTLLQLRSVLHNWIKETNDLGAISEDELIAKWHPNGTQPQLRPLEMEDKNGVIRLISKKSDATILWKEPQDSIWNIYKEPISNDSSFEAKAERIGFLDSEVLTMKLE